MLDTDTLPALTGDLVTPDQPEWDLARRAWNLAVDQRPAMVALPADEGDVLALVDYAIRNDLKIAPQGTGHNAAAIASLEDTILVSTQRMRGVEIDVAAQTARVQAGTLWLEVTEAATPHGLFPLSGSSPDVGVVGYTLGGGLSWLARKHGLSANNVTAIEVVRPDGRFVRATAEEHPDLFWALRGGGGNFGVVTAMEIRLFPYGELYAGMLLWPYERHAEVLRAWTTWTRTAPEEVTTSFRIIHFPPLPELPPFLSGRSVVVIDGAYAGDGGRRRRGARRAPRARAGDGHLGGVLAGGAEPDPHGPRGPDAVRGRHRAPRAARRCGARRVRRADPAGLARAVRRAAPPRRRGRPRSGGQRRRGTAGGRVPHVRRRLVMDAESGRPARPRSRASSTPSPPTRPASEYLNFVEQPADSASLYEDESYARLRAVRAAVDPAGRMVGNHPIPAS